MTDLSLLQTFGQSFPEEFDGSLDSISAALTCSFNRTGSLLAVGCNDGRLVIWDFLTRGIAKVLVAHVHPVSSVSWSRNGKKILTSSTDWNVGLWDVLSGDCEVRYRFPSAVQKVQFHPRDNNKFLVCPTKHPPVLIEVDGKQHILPVGEECEQNIEASFDKRGDYIFTGNAKGKITVIETNTLQIKTSYRISTATNANTAIKSIEFARRGNSFLVNSQDRVIRVFDRDAVISCKDGQEPEPTQKLQDLVNRTLWKKCAFSGDGEFIVAGSSRQHALYIWERSIGSLVKILHGTKGELLVNVVWHPIRPIICSVANGLVSIWSQTHVENWSAFAPDFKELDENIEYEERESEFDLTDEDKEELNNLNNEQHEEVEIDVISIDKPVYYSSDDDDDEDSLLYLPVAPDIDEPESDLLPGGEQLTSMKRSSISDLPETNEPSLKKAKVTDVSINGDIYDYKNVEAERFIEKPKPKAPNSTRSKRGGKKSSLGKNRKISPMGADIDDEISQDGSEKQAELTT
ncbi:retinoblastoma-binding protein 5 homolog isoform X2 [Hydra vulgaris]|uniref:Retinoblastoma-binding protein 5 homolog isoform X2 n=1 Tax=Hydra vulgaris TaxID=6087 RepID=A0ABM4B346_HYDVU